VKPDGSDPQHYLTGTIHELPKESARLCKMLEAKTVQEEFAKGKIDSSPGTPLKAVEPPITSPARRTKNVDLSRYLDGAKLTEKQYKCASLKWEYGLSVSQIAKELAIHRKTVGEHIQSAQNKMNRSGQYEAVKKHLARFNLDD
jgi:DNA-binding NarL/FixJ family response regulator